MKIKEPFLRTSTNFNLSMPAGHASQVYALFQFSHSTSTSDSRNSCNALYIFASESTPGDFSHQNNLGSALVNSAERCHLLVLLIEVILVYTN
jgi:hypothetical protein